jgi:hypothetical protein
VRRPALIWILAGLAVVLAIARLVLVIDDGSGHAAIAGVKQPESDVISVLVETLMTALYVGLGALVATRRTRNPVGWLLLTTGFSFSAFLLADRVGWHYLLADGRVTARAQDTLWIADWGWIPAVATIFIFLPLLFPTGRPLTTRWRRFAWTALGLVAVFLVADMLAPGPLENYTSVDNPFGTGEVATTVRDVSFPLIGAFAIASIASLAIRFRRSQGVERQQIKWVAASGAGLVMTFVGNALTQEWAQTVADIIQFTGLIALPIAVAVAILRYRLYDIAVVVNRTLVYGSLTAALAAVYLATVLLLQLILDPVTSGSSLAVAVSTLAVAGLFGPVRARIQAVVDKRFYRRKYDAARTLEAFSARLRDELDLDSLSSELRGVLQETMQPTHVSLWLRPSGE